MPRNTPSQSFQNLRNYTEKFQWRDKTTNLMTTGYNPPQGAAELSRVPYFIKYVTGKGRLEFGNVITLKVDRRRHQRTIQFVDNPSQIRVVRDYLVIEVDGTRFITH